MEIDVTKLPQAIQEFGDAMKWAAVTAGTRTAFIARGKAIESLREHFTLRNKWAQSKVRYKRATPEDMIAEVYVDSAELATQETGGTVDTGGGFPVPVGVYEAFGISEKKVIPKSLRARSIVGKTVKGLKPYIANKSGVDGVWATTDTGEKLLYALTPDLAYEPRPWFYDVTERAVEQNLAPEYDKALEEQWDRAISSGLSAGSGLAGGT